MTSEPDPVLAHLESRLGPAAGGWTHEAGDDGGPGGARLPFPIALFTDTPESGAVTVASLGLSDTVLRHETGADVRQELLFCARGEPRQELPAAVRAVGEQVREAGTALQRGRAVDFGGPLGPDLTIEGAYAAHPLPWGDDLHQVPDSDPPIVFVWLVPITRPELDFLTQFPWGDFEQRLDAESPDLLDLHRPPINLGEV